ncbi:MAG: hypothetical protein ACK5AZ_03230 [Bryobacteraceae bacterium]
MSTLLFCGSIAGLRADFSYEQSSKVTGGAMAGAMRFAGAFSKQLREPMRSTVMVKGDRMAMHSGDSVQIIDLQAETITDVNFQKKTYSVITFAQMAEAMRQMAERMERKDSQTDVNFKMDIKETGQSRTIQGLNARQTIMTLEVEGKDKRSGDQGAMNVVVDMWLAPTVAGYDEVKRFYQRMAEKLAWTPGANFAMAQPGMAKGLSEVYKQASKLDGVPVRQVTKLGMSAEGVALAQSGEMPAGAPQESVEGPTAGDVAGAAAGSAAAGAVGRRAGRLGGLAGGGLGGGLGGLSRRKKAEEQEQPPARPQREPEAQPQRVSVSGALMELTTELTGFSSAPVDAAKFQVPADFKQVESDMAKGLKK